MPIDFPASPTVGQQYTYNGVGYMFTAEGIWSTGLGTGVFVQKAGDTMTGLLTLSGDPTAALGAATKEYVDAHAGGGGAATAIGDTPPATPTVGQLWWDSATGVLYLYYNDGTSTQWVAVPAAAAPTPATGVVQHVYAENVA